MTPLIHASSSCSISLVALDIASLVNFSHFGGYRVVSHCDFITNFPYSSWSHMEPLYSLCCTPLESPQDSVSLFQKGLFSETAWWCLKILEFGFRTSEYLVESPYSLIWYMKPSSDALFAILFTYHSPLSLLGFADSKDLHVSLSPNSFTQIILSIWIENYSSYLKTQFLILW